MSQKITGKNLHYDSTLPPFLARMHGQVPSNSGGPDPLLARNRAYGKARSGSAEAEDAPVVLDEDGNVVSGLQVAADGTVKDVAGRKDENSGDAAPEVAGGQGGQPETEVKEVDKLGAIGGARKRKVGKVVGGDDEEDGGDAAPSRKAARPEDGTKEDKEKGKAGVKGKKKAKKIKLSFGDDEG
ncbi:hypothetical protein GQ53DRAFT_742103 [Thozetella sp. PMI_491]|nr:hypothetical protein GQ53DRAFT_742103 [Thozetella sp. PMI_491]